MKMTQVTVVDPQYWHANSSPHKYQAKLHNGAWYMHAAVCVYCNTLQGNCIGMHIQLQLQVNYQNTREEWMNTISAWNM